MQVHQLRKPNKTETSNYAFQVVTNNFCNALSVMSLISCQEEFAHEAEPASLLTLSVPASGSKLIMVMIPGDNMGGNRTCAEVVTFFNTTFENTTGQIGGRRQTGRPCWSYYMDYRPHGYFHYMDIHSSRKSSFYRKRRGGSQYLLFTKIAHKATPIWLLL